MANPLPRIPANVGPSRNNYLLQRIQEAREGLRANPNNYANLLQLGAALVQLSQHHTPADSEVFLNESIDVLEAALGQVPRSHNASWLLGCAHTSRATISTRTEYQQETDREMARICFQKAHKLEPNNRLYARTFPRDRMQEIRDFLADTWGWGAVGATALAGLCAAIWASRAD